MIPSTNRPSTHPAAVAANSAAVSTPGARPSHHAKGKEGVSPAARTQVAEGSSVKEAPIPRSYATAAADAGPRAAPVQQSAPIQAAAPVNGVARVDSVAPLAGASAASAAAMYAPSESAVVNINTYQGLLGIAARYDVTNISPKQMASLSQDLYSSGAISMQDAAMLSFQPPQSTVNGATPSPDADVDYYAKWEHQLTADAKQGDAAGVGTDQRILNILGNLVALRESVIGASLSSGTLSSASGPAPAPALGAIGATGAAAAVPAASGAAGANGPNSSMNAGALGAMSAGAAPAQAGAATRAPRTSAPVANTASASGARPQQAAQSSAAQAAPRPALASKPEPTAANPSQSSSLRGVA